MSRFTPTPHSTILLFTILLSSLVSWAQCPFPCATCTFETIPAPTPGTPTGATTCNFIGEYVTVTNVVAGDQYTVSYSGGTGNYAVVYDPSQTPIFWGPSPLTFTAPSSGDYYSASFIDASCGAPFSFACNISLWTNSTPVTPPPNNLPCTATPLASDVTCNFSVFTNVNATPAPGVPAPGCANYQGGDVWFTVTVPPSGNILIDTQQGTLLDGGMAIYSGTCNSLTLIDCDDDGSANGAMPLINVTGATPGQTLFVRVWDFGNNSSGTFGICAVESSLCGTPSTDDFCEAPSPLIQGPDNFAGSTSGGYTSDTPGNIVSSFCGSIENNVWYFFTASDTTEVFNFNSVTNCTSNLGIQAAVYEVFQDVNGCCNVLNLMSNCYSPSTPTTGTVTANSLTIGSQYILVVDGFSGDQCDFTIANWQIDLPIELSSFYGLTLTDFNAIRWETSSETNNDYFNVLRSYDDIQFEVIAQVDGVGNSQNLNYYQFNDYEVRSGKVYYQLEQVDFNGDRTKSDIIALDRKSTVDGLIAAYPNPTNGDITVEVNSSKGKNGALSVTNVSGILIAQKDVYTSGMKKHTFDLSNYASGVYFIRYQDDNSSKTIKLIKQ